ncbi:MAG: S8 family serine peptidase, partial [Thermoplasmata archaeon]
MKKTVKFSILVALISMILLSAYATISMAQEYVPEQLIVKFRAGITKEQIDAIDKEIGVRIIEDIPLIDAKLVKITAPITVEKAMEEYLRNPSVLYAHPNYFIQFRSHLTRPDDPLFPQQWGLDNRGQVIPSLGLGIIDSDIDAPQGWEHTTDCTKIVAIMDSGIDWTHPDLGGNIWQNLGEDADGDGSTLVWNPLTSRWERDAGDWDGADNDGNGYFDDLIGWDFVPSEDLDCDGALDLNEDLNGDDTFQPASEDIDGDGNFDTGEDTNHNGILDPNEDDGPGGLPPLDDGDGVLDLNEDLNGDGIFQPASEDIDGDGNFDTGEDTNHNGNLDIGDNNPRDELGHGTHVAGIVGAVGNNSVGVSGVCWRVPLMALRVATLANFVHGIDYAITMGANVINYSAGHYGPPVGAELGAIAAADAAGILFVTAAGYDANPGLLGNQPGNIDLPGIHDHPCKYVNPNIICVGASDNLDRYVTWCNWGIVSVDLAAPGDCILSTMPTYPVEYITDPTQNFNPCTGAIYSNNYDYMSGTSMATPFVSGVAAHCWTLFPTETHLEIKHRIMDGWGNPANPPGSGVDPRAGIEDNVRWGQGFSAKAKNNGRLRVCCGDDFGDAPPPYPTLTRYVGASHEDVGEEWLGKDVSPEFDANVWPPYDHDPIPNLFPFDTDFYDDGVGPIFILSCEAGLGFLTYKVCTENNDVIDAEGGRYGGGHWPVPHTHAAGDDKLVYINGFIDWNEDFDWDDANEHIFSDVQNPTAWLPAKCSDWIPVVFGVPPHDEMHLSITWLRVRLDYGENVGLPPYPRYESDLTLWYPISFGNKGLAQFGEVEDYPLVPVHIDTVVEKPDSQFVVYVEVCDTIPEEFLIYSAYFLLTYDSTVLDSTKPPCFEGTMLDSSGWDKKWHYYPGTPDSLEIWLIGGGDKPLMGKGPITRLHFRVNPSASPGEKTLIHFEKFMFNEGHPGAIVRDGMVIVNRPPEFVIAMPGTIYYNEMQEQCFTVEAFDPDGDSLILWDVIDPYPCDGAQPDTAYGRGSVSMDWCWIPPKLGACDTLVDSIFIVSTFET